jgi:hypothetical protein
LKTAVAGDYLAQGSLLMEAEALCSHQRSYGSNRRDPDALQVPPYLPSVQQIVFFLYAGAGSSPHPVTVAEVRTS